VFHRMAPFISSRDLPSWHTHCILAEARSIHLACSTNTRKRRLHTEEEPTPTFVSLRYFVRGVNAQNSTLLGPNQQVDMNSKRRDFNHAAFGMALHVRFRILPFPLRNLAFQLGRRWRRRFFQLGLKVSTEVSRSVRALGPNLLIATITRFVSEFRMMSIRSFVSTRRTRLHTGQALNAS